MKRNVTVEIKTNADGTRCDESCRYHWIMYGAQSTCCLYGSCVVVRLDDDNKPIRTAKCRKAERA